MSQISSNPTELELFQFYVARRLKNGGADSTVDQAVDEFREFKRQFDALKAKLREAEQSSANGLSAPLDLDGMFDRVDERLDKLGIPR